MTVEAAVFFVFVITRLHRILKVSGYGALLELPRPELDLVLEQVAVQLANV